MYLVSVLTAFFFGGILAMLIRTELLTPNADFFTQDQYNQMFTLHGAIMVFLFIIPVIPAALGNFVLPIMLGAKDVAFPRLNLFSVYLWCSGRAVLCARALHRRPGHRLDVLHAVQHSTPLPGVIPATDRRVHPRLSARSSPA
jgi:heme/copper-type cytochrome/quinol oxidase subunit 1